MPTCSSPVRHVTAPKRGPFDLHALGTPPALILSQDQTLHQFAVPPGSHRTTPHLVLPSPLPTPPAPPTTTARRRVPAPPAAAPEPSRGPVHQARFRAPGTAAETAAPHALAPSSAHEPSPALAGAPGAPATPAAFPPPSRPTAPVTTRRSVPPCPLVNVLRCPSFRSQWAQDRPALLQGGNRLPRFRGCSIV